MKSHWIWMVIGCGLPLLLIFFAPALGITGNNGLFGFIILMFVLHLFMPHGAHGHAGHKHAGRSKEEPRPGKEEEEEEEEGTQKTQRGHRHH